MLRYARVNEHQSAHTPTPPASTTPTPPTLQIHQNDENRNLIIVDTKETQHQNVSLLCGYNCFISEESEDLSNRANIEISEISHDNYKLGYAYLNVTTKPNSRYFMAFPYGNYTSILDVSNQMTMYVNRENFVVCDKNTVMVQRAYNVTTRNTDLYKNLMNKERWLTVRHKSVVASSSQPSQTLRRASRRRSISSPRQPMRYSRRHSKRGSVGTNDTFQIAVGGHSQLSVVQLRNNTIQVDDDNVVAIIGDINNIETSVIHSAQKKLSLTGTTTGRVLTGERTGEGLHFQIKRKRAASDADLPIYIVLQGNVYGHTEIIRDIQQNHQASSSYGSDNE